VADIGCGMGVLSGFLENKVSRYVGMDISIERLKQARLRNSSAKCFWVVGDAQNPPFKENCFDAVMSLEVIEHLPDSSAYLRGISRILKEKGTFILSTPGSLFFTDNTRGLYQDQHLYGFNPYRLAGILRKNYFKVRSIRGVGFRLHLVIPVWLGSDLIKYCFSKIKRVDLRSGYGVPISLEFDIVTHPWVRKFYGAMRSKKLWNFCMRIAGAVARVFPEFSSTMVVECRK
jgi:SAM-dependent methyltransferase